MTALGNIVGMGTSMPKTVMGSLAVAQTAASRLWNTSSPLTVGRDGLGGLMELGPFPSNDNFVYNGAGEIDRISANQLLSNPSNSLGYDHFDGWYCVNNNGGGITFQVIRNASDGPYGLASYFRMASTSVTTANAGTATGLQFLIEGTPATSRIKMGLAGMSPVTLSFFARASIAGYVGGGSLIPGNGISSSTPRVGIFEYTLASANTWYYVTWTWLPTTDSAVSGGWNNTLGTKWGRLGFSSCVNGGNGVAVSSPSTTIGATDNSGTNTSKIMTSKNETVKGIGSVSGATLDITGVKLEMGSVATPYQTDNLSDLLQKASRKFQTTIPLGVIPGDNLGINTGEDTMSAYAAATLQRIHRNFPVPMSAAPVSNGFKFYNPGSVAANNYWNETRSTAGAISMGITTINGFTANLTAVSGQAVNDVLRAHWSVFSALSS